MSKRVLIATTGSLGDLHPYLAIGLELRTRGSTVTIATNNYYRTKVERTGLEFAPMGPHVPPVNSEAMQRAMDLKKGPEYLLRQIMYPGVPAAYAEVMDALQRADVIVTHPIAFAAQIAAERTGMPWISAVPSPTVFFSRFDPPVLAPYPFLAKLRPLGPSVNGIIIRLARARTKPWMAPVIRFRASLRMAPGQDPVFEGQHSPQRVLALFSRVIAERQPDWPRHTLITGFVFYDQLDHGQGLNPDLQRFSRLWSCAGCIHPWFSGRAAGGELLQRESRSGSASRLSRCPAGRRQFNPRTTSAWNSCVPVCAILKDPSTSICGCTSWRYWDDSTGPGRRSADAGRALCVRSAR